MTSAARDDPDPDVYPDRFPIVRSPEFVTPFPTAHHVAADATPR